MRRSSKALPPWVPRSLFAVATLLLGYCACLMVDSWVFQRSAQATFALPAPPSAALPLTDGLIGSIEVQRLGLSVMIAEGATESVLRHAAGHIPGTALPGEPGNIGIAAHRDTFFRPLRNIRMHDAITLTTMHGTFEYRVVSTQIVPPEDTEVLDRDPGKPEVLTLVTCYPFYYVGPAPSRFIVRAERVTT